MSGCTARFAAARPLLRPRLRVPRKVVGAEKENPCAPSTEGGTRPRLVLRRAGMQFLNLIRLVKKYFLFIFCACVATGAASSWVAVHMLKNVYESTCMLIVVPSASGNASTLNYNDYTLSVDLVNSYKVLCKTNRILQKVIDQDQLPYSVSELASKITVEAENGTELIEITATDQNAVMAKTIANGVAEAFVSELPSIMNTDNVQIADPAQVPSQPASSNRRPFVLLSLAGCLAVCLLVIAAIEYFDCTVKDESQLEEFTGAPVLSCIPHIKQQALF